MMISYILRSIGITGGERNNKLLVEIIIIPILLISDKTVLSLSHRH